MHQQAKAVQAAATPAHKFDPMQVPAVIGSEVAHHAAAIDNVLNAFRKTRAITRSQMYTLREATAAIQRIARYSQQYSRLASGRLRQSHERVSLDELLRGVIRENEWRFDDAGITIEQKLQLVDVILDPGLLVSLLETALDCVARQGRHVQCFLRIKNWPEHGLLTLQVRDHVATNEAEAPPEDSIEWVMLLQLATAMGVMVGRNASGGHLQLNLEFPRTVRHLEGLTAVEVDAGGDSSLLTESKPLAGHRVLLITRDERLKVQVRDLCNAMRLVLDVCPTSQQAERYCELDKPDAIIVDEREHDDAFDELREDLLRYDVNFPFVEIAAQPNVVEVSSWMGDRMSRISRDALEAQLPSILAMELAKVF